MYWQSFSRHLHSNSQSPVIYFKPITQCFSRCIQQPKPQYHLYGCWLSIEDMLNRKGWTNNTYQSFKYSKSCIVDTFSIKISLTTWQTTINVKLAMQQHAVTRAACTVACTYAFVKEKLLLVIIQTTAQLHKQNSQWLNIKNMKKIREFLLPQFHITDTQFFPINEHCIQFFITQDFLIFEWLIEDLNV